MKNKVSYKENPNLFQDITEFQIDTIDEHRRGSNFFRQYIIELKEEDKKFFPEVENFEDYIGTWMSNTIVWDSENGADESVSELERVERKETVTYTWSIVY